MISSPQGEPRKIELSKIDLGEQVEKATEEISDAKSKIGSFKATLGSKEEFTEIKNKLTDLSPTISNTFKDAKATLSPNQKVKLTTKEKTTQKKIETETKAEMKNLQSKRETAEKDTKDIKKDAKEYKSEMKSDEKKLENSADKLESLTKGGGIKVGARFFGQSRLERSEKIAPQLEKADTVGKVKAAEDHAEEVSTRKATVNKNISDIKTDQTNLKENVADRLKTAKDVYKAISTATSSYDDLKKLRENKSEGLGFEGKKIDAKEELNNKINSIEIEIKELKTILQDLENSKIGKEETNNLDNRLQDSHNKIKKLTTETKEFINNLDKNSGQTKEMGGRLEKFAFKFFAFLQGKSKSTVAERSTQLNTRLENQANTRLENRDRVSLPDPHVLPTRESNLDEAQIEHLEPTDLPLPNKVSDQPTQELIESGPLGEETESILFLTEMKDHLTNVIINSDKSASDKIKDLSDFKIHLENNTNNKEDQLYTDVLKQCNNEIKIMQTIVGLGVSEARHGKDVEIVAKVLTKIIEYEEKNERVIDSLIIEMKESYEKLGEIVPLLDAGFNAANSRETIADAYQPEKFAPYIENATKIMNNYEHFTPKLVSLWKNDPILEQIVNDEFNKQISEHKINAANLFDLAITAISRLPKHPGEIGEIIKNTPDNESNKENITNLKESVKYFASSLENINTIKRSLDNKLDTDQAKFKALSNLLTNFDKNKVLIMGREGNFKVAGGTIEKAMVSDKDKAEAAKNALEQLAKYLANPDLAKRIGENEIKLAAEKIYFNSSQGIRSQIESSTGLDNLISQRERIRRIQLGE